MPFLLLVRIVWDDNNANFMVIMTFGMKRNETNGSLYQKRICTTPCFIFVDSVHWFASSSLTGLLYPGYWITVEAVSVA